MHYIHGQWLINCWTASDKLYLAASTDKNIMNTKIIPVLLQSTN